MYGWALGFFAVGQFAGKKKSNLANLTKFELA